MKEIAGDAALLTEPGNPAHMADALRFLAEDQGLRADLIAKGKQRSAEFTWARCAEQTMKVYQRALATAKARAER
jgi:alpha-1,3-rhamnosyl/mannosyltransferase